LGLLFGLIETAVMFRLIETIIFGLIKTAVIFSVTEISFTVAFGFFGSLYLIF
jgi:hypothetical protein